MITFKPTIFKDRMRQDKTWTVFIRITYQRKIRYIQTSMSVSKKDLTASAKIKNQQILDRCDEIIRKYRVRVNSLNLEFNDIDIDRVVDVLSSKDNQDALSFTVYADKWLADSKIKGLRNYNSAVNALKRFFQKDNILFSEITAYKMKEFVDYLSDRPRSQSLYTNAIVKIFNDARDFYNDEEADIIRIKHSLRKFHAPRQNVAEKRALSLEQVRAIFELPYLHKTNKGYTCRRDLAKDCFMLSFCLMGMNSADLYSAGQEKGEGYADDCITYYRRKTKDRRSDNAKIIVKVNPIIQPLFQKYRGKYRIFNFHERFSSMSDLNRAINIGLKQIGEELGIDNLQFYSARHSFATIAANNVKIDRYTINLMLNHTDNSMKVTELYIREDFSQINEANKRLLEYVFKGF